MEKYEAIIKCINDKLRDNEILLEHYREETSKKDRRILELEEEVNRLKDIIENSKSMCKEI